MTGAEPFAVAGEAVPSLGAAALRIGLFLAAFGAAAVGWLVWQRRVRRGPRRIAVVDRAVLSRGVSVALLRVDAERLLVGVSADGVRLIRALEQEDAEANEPASEPPATAFARVLERAGLAGGAR